MTANRRKPWYRRWQEDALNGYRGLSLELRGAYTTLLDLMYDHGGPLRDEPRLMCAWLDCDLRVWKRVRAALVSEHAKLQTYTDEKGVAWLVNDRAQKEMGLKSYAELTANLSPKLAIANAELSANCSEKPSENNETEVSKKPEITPLYPLPYLEPPLVPQGDDQIEEEGLFEKPPPDDVRTAFDLWNETAARCGLPTARDLTEARQRSIRKRLKAGGLDLWREAMAAVEVSAFLTGQRTASDGRTFRADLGFVLQDKSFQRIVEGFYGADAVRRPAPAEPVDPLALWRHRVGEFRRNLYWNDLDWGPRPKREGCRAPLEILVEFGFAPEEGSTVVPFHRSDRSAA